eukprot:2633187-Pleurochrysis_carterae.AAC.1
MPTTCTSAHRCPLLAADGARHSTEAHVRSRVQSNSLSCGWPISPARRRRLCASSAAAQSSRLCSVHPLAPASAAARKCAARNARLSFRVPGGGSSLRMRFSASDSGVPGISGAMSHPASLERSSLTADTYPPMVSARNVAPVLLRCREPHCRMNSAKSASVS